MRSLANVHASIAGTVKEIAERCDGRGVKGVHIVIAPSEKQETDYLPPLIITWFTPSALAR